MFSLQSIWHRSNCWPSSTLLSFRELYKEFLQQRWGSWIFVLLSGWHVSIPVVYTQNFDTDSTLLVEIYLPRGFWPQFRDRTLNCSPRAKRDKIKQAKCGIVPTRKREDSQGTITLTYSCLVSFIWLSWSTLQKWMEAHNFHVKQVLHCNTDLQIYKQRSCAILEFSAK